MGGVKGVWRGRGRCGCQWSTLVITIVFQFLMKIHTHTHTCMHVHAFTHTHTHAHANTRLGQTDCCLSPLVSAKACHKCQMESRGYSTRCHMLGRERPEAVLPDRALYLPTFSHLLIVNKLLSLSISLALSVGVLCVGRCACEEDRYFSNCPSPRDDGYRYAAGSHVVSHMLGAQENGHCCSRALLLSQV